MASSMSTSTPGSIYQSNPDAAPDDDFEPGRLEHLVIGNAGRLLDPRRTPVTLVEIRPDLGLFTVRLDDFEDRGATWEIPFEGVDAYQFTRGGATAAADDVERYRGAITRFDRGLVVACSPDARRATWRRLADTERRAASWLADESRFLAAGHDLPDPDQREGDPLLFDDLGRYMTTLGLAEIETAFARQFVSNPFSGELVKGHRIVIAEIGLVPFDGTVVRHPDLFDEPWTTERRGEHVIARLAFLRALMAALGREHVALYRGLSTDGPLKPPRNETFVSASFSRAVALSHFDASGPDASRALLAMPVPVSRLFMTYLETAEMNRHFREAEAVLLHASGSLF
jgi:hypothetical protein